eukprot:Nk52_evm69s210 gene=Nk52_evmTU69s210
MSKYFPTFVFVICCIIVVSSVTPAAANPWWKKFMPFEHDKNDSKDQKPSGSHDVVNSGIDADISLQMEWQTENRATILEAICASDDAKKDGSVQKNLCELLNTNGEHKFSYKMNFVRTSSPSPTIHVQVFKDLGCKAQDTACKWPVSLGKCYAPPQEHRAHVCPYTHSLRAFLHPCVCPFHQKRCSANEDEQGEKCCPHLCVVREDFTDKSCEDMWLGYSWGALGVCHNIHFKK